MAITIQQRLALKKLVNELKSHKAAHTEFVSVYVPQGYELSKIINHISEEQGTASNIKSTSTRKNVQAALERMIQHLRNFKRTPENGLAVFSGNVAAMEGKENFQVWSIEPPVPLNIRIYRCDKNFVTDILEDMMTEHRVYGLVVLDRRDAIIAILKGKTIVPLQKTHSEVPGKFKAGGQCCLKGTFVQSARGSILKIENCHNPLLVKGMVMDNFTLRDSPITDKWVTTKQQIFKIKTKNPSLVVETSKDHIFFVSTTQGIQEKAAEELHIGDTLIMPEKIEVAGRKQHLNVKRYYNSFTINKEGQKLLKQKRIERGLHQKQLASKISVKQTTISSYELGKLNAEKATLQVLCTELGLDFEKFIEEYALPFHYMKKNVKLPDHLSEDFAQFLGYYIGDGCIEKDRITFFEQRKEVATVYKKKFDELFNIHSTYKFREKKNYHQLRFTSRPLVRLVQGEFPEIKKTLDTEIPAKIMESGNEVVAGFLRGLFDAEGYVHKGYGIGIAANNKGIIQQIQLLLLRFSILSSFLERDNNKNPYSKNPVFSLQTSEKRSLQLFQQFIGFTSLEKQKDLQMLINQKSDKSCVRQIIVPGTKVRQIIERAGYNTQLFPKVNNFFRNERMMSKQAFKSSVLGYVKDENLRKKLEDIYNHPLLPVKIHSIEKFNKAAEMVDLSVGSQNFIANGIIVHNSAARFSRIREGAYKDHFKKIADYMKEQFLPLGNNLKGIIIGGPGTTVQDFLGHDYITGEIKRKIIGTKDLSYTEEIGLQELLDRSEDLLADEEVAQEKKIMNSFFDALNKTPGKVTYGEQETRRALERNVVDILLLSESLLEHVMIELEELAQKGGATVAVISTETREGAQLRDLGKIAALLRFELA